jgi:hypothetical protein
MMKLTSKHIETAKRLRDQIGKCRAWITGYEAGSGKTVLESDSLRQVQLFLDEIARGSEKSK